MTRSDKDGLGPALCWLDPIAQNGLDYISVLFYMGCKGYTRILNLNRLAIQAEIRKSPDENIENVTRDFILWL